MAYSLLLLLSMNESKQIEVGQLVQTRQGIGRITEIEKHFFANGKHRYFVLIGGASYPKAFRVVKEIK